MLDLDRTSAPVHRNVPVPRGRWAWDGRGSRGAAMRGPAARAPGPPTYLDRSSWRGVAGWRVAASACLPAGPHHLHLLVSLFARASGPAFLPSPPRAQQQKATSAASACRGVGLRPSRGLVGLPAPWGPSLPGWWSAAGRWWTSSQSASQQERVGARSRSRPLAVPVFQRRGTSRRGRSWCGLEQAAILLRRATGNLTCQHL